MNFNESKLGDLCEIRAGGTPSRSNSEYWNNGDIPWIKIGDINNKYVKSASEYITLDGLNNSSAKLFKKGTILYTIFATVGEVAILDFDATTNQAIVGLNHNEKIDTNYLYYFLKSQKDKISNIGRGVAQNNINMSILRDIKVPIPDKNVQLKISEVLDNAQVLIDKRKKQIEELELLVKSKFIEMFGDPINNPMKWEVKKMKDISVNIMSGNTPKGGEQVYVESGIMFLRSQNVWKNKLLLDDVAYIDQATHNKMKKSSLKNKDILMTKTGRINTENSSLGRAAMFLGEDDSANINGHVYLIRLQEQIINEFVLYILTSKEYRGYIRSVCVGGIDKRQLNKEHIEDFPIIFPPIEKQKKFVSYVKQVDKLKFEMEKSLKELEDNFNSLMQKAFKGELFN